MKAKATIHINGQDYDATSGVALNAAANKSVDGVSRPHHHVSAHHKAAPRRSETLLRTAVKKPRIVIDVKHTPLPDMLIKPKLSKTPEHTDVKKSAKIKHFSPIEPRMIDMTPTPPPILEFPPTTETPKHHKHLSKTEHHLQKQLQAAESHKHTFKKPQLHHRVKHHIKHKKGRSLAMAAAALALIAGFALYQNRPGLSTRVAGARAGFSAELPTYTPSGFKFVGPVDYANGKVVLTFNSKTDDRKYQLEQSPSNLTTEELKAELAAKNFQAITKEGITIFLINGSATWVNNQVLYSLKGESGLSSSQIASIATSL